MGGSAIAGAGFGTLKAIFAGIQAGKAEQRRHELELSGKSAEFQKAFKLNQPHHKIKKSYFWGLYTFDGIPPPHAVKPPHNIFLLCITVTYCAVCLICFLAGDVPVLSQSFASEPSSWGFGWGLVERTIADKTVYILTLAGLGTYFMSPLAFVITNSTTGHIVRRLM